MIPPYAQRVSHESDDWDEGHHSENKKVTSLKETLITINRPVRFLKVVELLV